MTSAESYHGTSSGDSRSDAGRSVCKHCGLPLNNVRQVQDSQFCCNGCATVYRILHEQGLQKFYDLKQQGYSWKQLPAKVTGSTYLHFDDPNFFSEYVATGPDLASITFFLEGIHCSACVWLLEKVPMIVNGVFQVTANIARSEVIVRFDPARAKLSEVGATLDSLGYHPFPVKGSASEELRKDSERRLLYRIGVALFCAVGVMFIADARYQGIFSGIEAHFSKFFIWFSLILTTPVVFYSAIPFYRTAFGGLRAGRLHIDLPVAIAIISAYVPSVVNTFAGAGEIYFDSITDLVFLLLTGRYIQARGLARAADASELLYTVSPISAVRISGGEKQSVYVESLSLGDILEINPGEVVPADGTLLEGESHMNFSVLTGESVPRKIMAGDKLFSGVQNLTARIRMRVEAFGKDSRIGRIMKAIEDTQQEKAPIVEITDKISVYFVVTVLILAVVAIFFWAHTGFYPTLNKVIALLVVTCPCALGLATPVALSVAIAKASRAGIVINGADVIERVTQIKEIAFDKTGTLTLGVPSVKESLIVESWLARREQVFEAIAALEFGANHPVGRALAAHAGAKQVPLPSQTSELAGRGVEGVIQHLTWRIGSVKWFRELSIDVPENVLRFVDRSCNDGLGVVLVAADQIAVAAFSIGDVLRPEAAEVIRRLREFGLEISLLSGDLISVAKKIGKEAGISESRIFGELSPEEKAAYLRQHTAAYVGDGINDAAALQAASLGISVRGGAEIAVKVSSVFLAREGLQSVLELFLGARRTLKLVYINLFISLMYNAVGAVLAFMGYIGPLIAAVLMPISSLSVIATSIAFRSFGKKPWR